ncbi:MAG TPA: hypothetical protein VD813_05700 [Pseudonocardia sp.]|nr:hypothetical protein [Pseudonocardia sp.]
MTISAEHLRRLLNSPPEAQLVVREGHAAVAAPGDVGTGALTVLSHAELRARLGGHEPSDEMLDALAARLDSAVSSMGG